MPVILHLSDLHFGQEKEKAEQLARSVVLDRLIDSLTELPPEWHPDIVCISGDIAYKGHPTEYQQAEGWLRRLLQAIKLPATALVISPGNHDVDRDALEGIACPTTAEEADRALSLRTEHMTVHRNYYAAFTAFSDFCDRFDVPKVSIGQWDNHLVGGRELYGIHFVVLNSAWFAKGDDKGRLWLGNPQLVALEAGGQLRSRKEPDGQLYIAVVHHPHNWLHDKENIPQDLLRPSTVDYLAKRCDLVLTGHTHTGLPKEPDIINNGARMIAAGATYDNHTYPNRFVLLRVDSGELTIRHVIWEAGSSELQRWKPYAPDYTYRLGPDKLMEPRAQSQQDMTNIEESTALVDNTITDQYPMGVTLSNYKHFPDRKIGSVRWSPDGQSVGILLDGHGVDVLDSVTLKIRRQLPDVKAKDLAWAPDGRRLTSATTVWNAHGWAIDHKLNPEETMRGVSWSKERSLLAEATGTTFLRVWNAAYGEVHHVVHGLPSAVTCVAWSPTKDVLVFGCEDGSIRFRDIKAGETSAPLRGHSGPILAIAFSPDGLTLATASSDRTIRLWDVESRRQTNSFEGHTNHIVDLSFAETEPILASAALDDTIKLWRYDTEEYLGTIPVRTRVGSEPGLNRVSFSAQRTALVFVDDGGATVRVCELDSKTLYANATKSSTVHYTNAKVVLVGDSGVGKSGLGLRLSGYPFSPTESTHGRHVWTFDKTHHQTSSGKAETREVLLWDLAGQAGYRLIHQLYLNEVAVALVVFDGKSETDPFAGVGHWARALRQAQRLPENNSVPMSKILVAARTDRGGVGVHSSRVEALLKQYGFDTIVETSAKEGWGIEDLHQAIQDSIPWDSLPHVNSTRLFERIKSFLLAQKQAGRMVDREEALYQAFLVTEGLHESDVDLKKEFETCISLVQSRGLIRKLHFGSLILMQPELLDAYASAIVNAAKDQPDGFGSIAEEDVKNGKFRMSADERLSDTEQERWLLLAVIQDFIDHEIALREESEDGVTQVVFPSQFTREFPDAPELEGKAVIFDFEGPIMNVYATLTVRLAHSEIYTKKDMWRNAAVYTANSGGECGLSLRLVGEGKGELTVFYDRRVTGDERFEFEQYVRAHLKRRAIPESIVRRPVYVCPKCGTPVSELQYQRRKAAQKDFIRCNVCESIVPFKEPEEARAAYTAIRDIDGHADSKRREESAKTVLVGKVQTKDHDLYLVNKLADSELVNQFGNALRNRGLLCIPCDPSASHQEWFEEMVGKGVKAVAICVGPETGNSWVPAEVKRFIYYCNRARITVIPVLLPGTKTPINGLGSSVLWVQLRSANDEVSLDAIEAMAEGRPVHNLFGGQLSLVVSK